VYVLPKRLFIRRALSLSTENSPAGTFWEWFNQCPHPNAYLSDIVLNAAWVFLTLISNDVSNRIIADSFSLCVSSRKQLNCKSYTSLSNPTELTQRTSGRQMFECTKHALTHSETRVTPQILQQTSHALEYIHKKCTKSPTCFGSPWLPSFESLHGGWSSAFEMVRCLQQSHTCTRIKIFRSTTRKM
jgi:hypothetical protein